MFGLEDTLDQKLQQVKMRGWLGTLCLALVQSVPTTGTDLSLDCTSIVNQEQWQHVQRDAILSGELPI